MNEQLNASEAGRPPQRRHSDRRRLWDRRARDDRRAGANRRRKDRRTRVVAVARDRRAGLDRRFGDRRLHEDRRIAAGRRLGRRRRSTPAPYTPVELAELKIRFAQKGVVRCPACDGTFTLGETWRRGDQSARRVTCHGCARTAIVPNAVAARIILVDDLGERRDAIRGVLAGVGHDVVETDDAGVALRAYEAVPADVILLNVMATGRMDPASFLRRLLRTFPRARVVAVAGRASQGSRDPLALAHGLGATATLRIPASADDVLRAVDLARRS